MQTLYDVTAPDGGIRVRLIERMTFVPPASQRRSFALIVDVTGELTRFETFHDMEYAFGAFLLLCQRFSSCDVTVGPIAVMWP